MLCAALCLLSAPSTVAVPAYAGLGSMPATPGMGCLGAPGRGCCSAFCLTATGKTRPGALCSQGG